MANSVGLFCCAVVRMVLVCCRAACKAARRCWTAADIEVLAWADAICCMAAAWMAAARAAASRAAVACAPAVVAVDEVPLDIDDIDDWLPVHIRPWAWADPAQSTSA